MPRFITKRMESRDLIRSMGRRVHHSTIRNNQQLDIAQGPINEPIVIIHTMAGFPQPQKGIQH